VEGINLTTDGSVAWNTAIGFVFLNGFAELKSALLLYLDKAFKVV